MLNSALLKLRFFVLNDVESTHRTCWGCGLCHSSPASCLLTAQFLLVANTLLLNLHTQMAKIISRRLMCYQFRNSTTKEPLLNPWYSYLWFWSCLTLIGQSHHHIIFGQLIGKVLCFVGKIKEMSTNRR